MHFCMKCNFCVYMMMYFVLCSLFFFFFLYKRDARYIKVQLIAKPRCRRQLLGNFSFIYRYTYIHKKKIAERKSTRKASLIQLNVRIKMYTCE